MLRPSGHQSSARKSSATRLRPQNRRAFRPQLEILEGRQAPSTFTVSTLADSGAGSLRQAITDANANPGPDTIDFNVTGTIALLSALPGVSDSVEIVGPGAQQLTIDGSRGSQPAGIFLFAAGTTDTVRGLTVTHGTNLSAGGAISNSGMLTVEDCVLTGNTAPQGGAIDSSGALTAVRDTLLNNAAQGAYGGSTLSGGTGFGGAIRVTTGTAVIGESTLSQNQALGGEGTYGGAGDGGAVYVDSGDVTLTNDTISGNLAYGGGSTAPYSTAGSDFGGGLSVNTGTAVLVNCTVTGNSAPVDTGRSDHPAIGVGGGLMNWSGTISLLNTIVAQNTAYSSGPDGSGTFTSQDYNLIGTTSSMTLVGPTQHTIIGRDPRLDKLANNGGPTPTLALLAGSPAIDAGTTTAAPTTDQRGFPRGVPDIGAYEAHPWVQAISDQSAPEGKPLTISFAVGDQALFAQEPITSITVTSDNQTLLPKNSLQVGGSGGRRTLTITPVAGRTGVAQITVTVSAGSQSMSDTFQLTLRPGPVQAHAGPIAGVAEGAGSVVFVINPDRGLMRFDNSTGWVRIGGAGTIASVSAVLQSVPLQGGTRPDVVAFVVTTDNALAEYDDLHGWQLLSGPGTVRSASAGTDRNGLADAFVLTTADTLTEWSASSGWLPSPIGAAGSILDFSAFSRDRVDVVATDHALYRYDPQSGWLPLSGPGFAQAVSTAADGTTFALTPDDALYRHDPSGWVPLGGRGTIGDLDAGLDASGRPQVFVLTTQDVFAEYTVQYGWQSIGNPGTIDSFSAANGGRVFTVLSDGSVDGHDDALGWFTLGIPGWQGQDVAVGNDGRTRLLWSTATGSADVWVITGASNPVPGAPFGQFSGWSVKAVAAGGSDGLTRLHWTRTGGAALWLLNPDGTLNASHEFFNSNGSDWEARDVAVDSTQHTQILWFSPSSGAMRLESLDNAFNSQDSPAYVPWDDAHNWSAVKLDAGVDGLVRVLWTNVFGEAAVWVMSGGEMQSEAAYGNPLRGWTPIDLSVGSDGLARILWADASADAAAVWTLSSTLTVASISVYGGSALAGWQARALSAGNDGLLRLEWSSYDGTVAVWLVDNAGTFVSSGAFGPF